MKASAVTQPFGAARLLRSVLLPVFVAGASLTIAVVGALLVGADSGIDWVNAAVEARAGESAGRWEFVGALGFAFAAGAVAAFNPCGFAMLPAYMGLYMGTNDKSEDSRRLPRQQPAALVGAVMAGFVMLYGVAVGIGWFTGGWSWYVPFVLFGIPGLLELSIGTVLLVTPATISIIRLGELRSSLFSVARQLARALLVGGSVTVGFVVLFAAAGAIIGLGARSLVASVLPWLGLSIGIALAIVGSWLIGGGKLYTALAAQAAARMGDPSQVNVKGYFMFGLSYGTASLSCTLPIFLAVVGTSFAASSIATSFSQFVLYALGMGMVIIALTVGMALFKTAMVSGLREVMPYIAPVGSWLMVIAGSYIVFYWLSIGGLLD